MTVHTFLLGIAQDAGVPQAGCACENCAAARVHPAAGHKVACLGIADTRAHRCWLIDATPDFRAQHDQLLQLAAGCTLNGIFLTHAHIGHYAGLIHLGPEAMNARGLPLYVTARMAAFLLANAPWSTLIDRGHVQLRTLARETALSLSDDLDLPAVRVPNRDEFSDAVAFAVQGPRRRLLYCPDIDAWERWDRDAREYIGDMDIALVDGSFYSPDEIPGREIRTIPHPLATTTAELLSGLSTDVRLIHLNHTSPLLRAGPERARLAAQGVAIGQPGDAWEL